MTNSISHTNFLINSSKARNAFNEGNYLAAYQFFVDMFKSAPDAWWLSMEAFRSIRAQRIKENLNKSNGRYVLFSPDYSLGNPYQKNLYSEAMKFGYKALPFDVLKFDTLPTDFNFSENNVFHQHWINGIYWNSNTFNEGVLQVQKYINAIKALQNFGVKIAWTLHNLVDHDASDLQTELCVYTHRKIAEISDIIYVHTPHSGELLSAQCGINLATKLQLLEHSLYDSFTSINKNEIPQEINLERLSRKKILVCLGMIKPYKGVPNLLKAFEHFSSKNPNHSLFLIIGGKIYDTSVRGVLDTLSESTRDRLLIIDRRLTEGEIASILNLANISITPYKKILVSGNFYLSTTFSKPTVAPSIGMFKEIIKDGETGFLYDGSIDGLISELVRISETSEERLAEIGKLNFIANQHLTTRAVSERYFNSLRIVNE